MFDINNDFSVGQSNLTYFGVSLVTASSLDCSQNPTAIFQFYVSHSLEPNVWCSKTSVAVVGFFQSSKLVRRETIESGPKENYFRLVPFRFDLYPNA